MLRSLGLLVNCVFKFARAWHLNAGVHRVPLMELTQRIRSAKSLRSVWLIFRRPARLSRCVSRQEPSPLGDKKRRPREGRAERRGATTGGGPNKKTARRRSIWILKMRAGDQAKRREGPRSACLRRYAMKPSPQKPRIIMAQVEGSGTAAVKVTDTSLIC
jgi:hypothetical protein